MEPLGAASMSCIMPSKSRPTVSGSKYLHRSSAQVRQQFPDCRSCRVCAQSTSSMKHDCAVRLRVCGLHCQNILDGLIYPRFSNNARISVANQEQRPGEIANSTMLCRVWVRNVSRLVSTSAWRRAPVLLGRDAGVGEDVVVVAPGRVAEVHLGARQELGDERGADAQRAGAGQRLQRHHPPLRGGLHIVGPAK